MVCFSNKDPAANSCARLQPAFSHFAWEADEAAHALLRLGIRTVYPCVATDHRQVQIAVNITRLSDTSEVVLIYDRVERLPPGISLLKFQGGTFALSIRLESNDDRFRISFDLSTAPSFSKRISIRGLFLLLIFK